MEKILIADDSELNRDMLKAIFEEQFEVVEAADGQEAIDIIEEMRGDISVVFLDLMMPKKTGLEVLEFMRNAELQHDIPVIMITGEATTSVEVKAFDLGVSDVIYKPFSHRVVMRRTMNLMEQFKSREKVEAELAEKTKALVESREEIENMNMELLEALGSVVEFKSNESGDHIKRVSAFTKIILQYVKECYPEYGLTDEQIIMMSRAAMLHDVGKIAIPDSILNKPGKLTDEEFREMKKHTTYGCEILERFKFSDNDFYKYCYDICRWHHEKVDGKGYPDALVGDEIPIYCQAVAIADCFDALVSKRVYKSAIDCVESYNMIKRGECGAFSDVILHCFDMAKLEMFMMVEKVQSEEQYA